MTDEYLKMILALPEEFFDGWKWKEGDQFLRYNHECKYVEIQGHVGNYSLYSYTGKIRNINETGDYVEGDLRPVPSQEQLQKMILNYYFKNGLDIKGRENLYLLWRFQDWLRGQSFEDCSGLTIKELMLEFLMYVVYTKKWDGKKWI